MTRSRTGRTARSATESLDLTSDGQHILDEHNEPVPCRDFFRWAQWFEQDERRVVRKNTFLLGKTEITMSRCSHTN